MNRFAVIGSGNAGAISAIMIKSLLMTNMPNQDNEYEITVFHDPNTPREIVGQGTTLDVSYAIHKILNVDERIDNPVGITPKVGFFYKNWARKNNNLLYKLGENGMSYHYDPKLLREQFLKSNHFNFIEKNVSPEDISKDFDLIVDCRGKSCNNWEDYNILENPVNYCLIGRTHGSRAPEVYTENIATPDGWCFKIPLSDGHSYGYIFNDKITPIEEAEKNFKEMFKVDVKHKIPFKNYISKKLFHNYNEQSMTILNGNRFFFLEPLESTATPMYGVTISRTIEDFYSGQTPKEIENTIFDLMNEVHEWIMWHYFYGSSYDTKFWNYAKEMSRSFHYSTKFIERIKFIKNYPPDKTFEYPQFPGELGGEFSEVDYAIWFHNNV